MPGDRARRHLSRCLHADGSRRGIGRVRTAGRHVRLPHDPAVRICRASSSTARVPPARYCSSCRARCSSEWSRPWPVSPTRSSAPSTHLNLSPIAFLFLVNAVLLVLGCFLDGFTLLTVVTPLLLPTVKALDINLIHFAIVLTLNIEIAAITPPVGLNLFVITGISGTTMQEVMAGAFPFVFALLARSDPVHDVPGDRALCCCDEDMPMTNRSSTRITTSGGGPTSPGCRGRPCRGFSARTTRSSATIRWRNIFRSGRHRRRQVGLCADQLGQGTRD